MFSNITNFAPKKMNQIVNVAIQVLPQKAGEISYSIVDKAIEIIKESGFKYQVCPFETVVEGEFKAIMKLIETIHEVCYNEGTISMLTYIKIESSSVKEVDIEDKIGKYR